MVKKIGFIGLGKMGLNIAVKIINSGYSVFVYDSDKKKTEKIGLNGAEKCRSIEEIPEKLTKPKVIILCVPTGKVIDVVIKQLSSGLSVGDTVIDLGNSFYKDSQMRNKVFAQKGIEYIDAGMSGGISGAKFGACLMIGGNKGKVSELKDLFKAMSRNGSYKYIGKSGAGHLVKGYHNLIEYGYLQSMAEGLESLYRIFKKENMVINLEEICDIWSKGSIIESRILLDAKKAFKEDPLLKKVNGSVYGQTLQEMEELIKIAAASGVNIYSCKAAIKARIESQRKPTYSGKIINATRNIFGGHKDWKK